jgi:hypothetical protein
VDILAVKGRVVVAFVESIFRRAGFTVAPAPPRNGTPRGGRDDVVPHFLAERATSDGHPAIPPPRPVEVRYRPQVAQYVSIEEQRGPQSLFALAKRHWPDLLFVFVTDRPEPGRSAFQAVDVGAWQPGTRAVALDLHAQPGLDIFPQNVEDHEILLRRVLGLVSGTN